MPTQQPPAPPPPTQEIRFAVVMYGGVSLCIYINGVAQELLRLVRATAQDGDDGDEVAAIYRDLASQAPSVFNPKEKAQTRFVVDILSGTSAGGINAVFLAKALVSRSKNLNDLRDVWLNKADMKFLLNTGGVLQPKRSLLKGPWMYEQLLAAFRAMNSPSAQDAAQGYSRVDHLDLFVTTTDLNGVPLPMMLADRSVSEKAYKGSFHFRLDQRQVAGTQTSDDFDAAYDAMLAFASRCTSSFPVAFPPMKFADIRQTVRADFERCRTMYRRFFRWVPEVPLEQTGVTVEWENRELADGGYLDNKPFGFVIDALQARPVVLPHARKLLFVDPFPEDPKDANERDHFTFIDNALAAANNLPTYETIRGDIDRIKISNRTQERLKLIERIVEPPLAAKFAKPYVETSLNDMMFGWGPKSTAADAPTSPAPGADGTQSGFGPSYGTYHFVRVANTFDDIARIVVHNRGSVDDEDLFLGIRYVVRYWHDQHYSANPKPGKKLDAAFLTEFDFSFRLRRAIHLLQWARQNGTPEMCEMLANHLTRLHRKRDELASLHGVSSPLRPILANISSALDWAQVQDILKPTDDDERMKRAERIYSLAREGFEALAGVLRAQWDAVFDTNRRELKAMLDKSPPLKAQYLRFDLHDLLSLAYLEGSEIHEHTQTEIYRVSPADDGIGRPPSEKLAGYHLAHFGAFLSRDWRTNDMFWGRLDAAERIVDAILTRSGDEAVRADFVKRLQRAIWKQERGEPIPDDVPGYLKDPGMYKVPPAPEPGQSAAQMAKATDILGRMLEEDVGYRGRPVSILRTVAGLATGLVAFLTPGGFWRVVWNYWIQLLFLISGLVLLAGRYLPGLRGSTGLATVGWYGLGGALVIWVLSLIIGAYLAAKGWVRYGGVVLKWAITLVVTALLLSGLWHFSSTWNALVSMVRGWLH